MEKDSSDSCCSGEVAKPVIDKCCTGETATVAMNSISASNIETGTPKTTFKVLNMDCPDEIKVINDVLRIKGVLEVKANLMASTIQIIHTKEISEDFLKKRINSTVVKVVENENLKNPRSKLILEAIKAKKACAPSLQVSDHEIFRII